MLLEVEAEEMRQKLDSVVEKQTYIERTQQEILRTQNAILSCLDVVEKSLRPQMQSTPHRYARPRFESTSSSWQRQQWLDDDYGTEWNSMVYPLQQFPDISHCYQPDPTYTDISHHYQPDPPHRKSLHPTNHQSLEHPQENSSYSPEPFGIKFGENILPSSEIPRAGLVPAEHILQKFSRLRCESKVGTLAVKLAREAIFGDKSSHTMYCYGRARTPWASSYRINGTKANAFQTISPALGSPLWVWTVVESMCGSNRTSL